MTDLEKIQDQLNLALNEIKTTLTVEQGELIHDYVFEAQRLVKKLILPDVMAMLPTNEEIQYHIEKHTRHNNGEAAMDEQTFYEGAKWLKEEFCNRVEGN